MRKYRSKKSVENDLRPCREKFKNHRRFFLLSIIGQIVLTTLFIMFVIGKGNTFDYVASAFVLGFFMFMSIIHISKSILTYKRVLELQKEYEIACETPEQRLARERTEKMERILETDKEKELC
jgi:hypothetical protein